MADVEVVIKIRNEFSKTRRSDQQRADIDYH